MQQCYDVFPKAYCGVKHKTFRFYSPIHSYLVINSRKVPAWLQSASLSSPARTAQVERMLPSLFFCDLSFNWPPQRPRGRPKGHSYTWLLCYDGYHGSNSPEHAEGVRHTPHATPISQETDRCLCGWHRCWCCKNRYLIPIVLLQHFVFGTNYFIQGMLASAEAIHVVADAFRHHNIGVSVVDPVLQHCCPC